MRSETETDAPGRDGMHLFAGMMVEQARLGLATELRWEAERLCAENGWSEAEGWRIIFAYGLSVLAHEDRMQRLSVEQANLDTEIERLERRYMDLESRYAVMKYQAYTLGHDRQILEMNRTGLQVELEGMRQRLVQCQADIERLQAEAGGIHPGTLPDSSAEPDGR